MIPVKLKLRNFMCYRDNVPPLDFTGIHLACLSGDNGNGKSAIIDAITWALWGKARAGSDDELIHSTQNDMEVEFDFMVGTQLYRIVRKRSRPKKRTGAGLPSLELQACDGETFRSITGDTIARTQQKLIETLHMDYDTFINSAYLRQGHDDEFTRQPPGRRKEVLGSILGLARYDELEDRARTLARAHEAESARLENAVREIESELALRPAHEAELVEARETVDRFAALCKEKETALAALLREKEALEARQAQAEELEARLTAGAAQLLRWEEQAARHLARVKGYEEVIARRDEIEAGYARFVEAKKRADELDRTFRQSVGLERQKAQLERRIDESRNELLKDHALIQHDITTLEGNIKKLPDLKGRLAQVQAQLLKLAEPEAARRQQEQTVREAQQRIAYLEAEESRLDREIAEVTEKLDLIASHLESHTEATCPLCERELTREGLELIQSKYSREKGEKLSLLEANRAGLAKQRAEHDARQQEAARLEAGLGQEKTRLQGQASVLGRDIAEIEKDEARQSGLKESLGGIEQALAGRDFAAAEQAALASVEVELAKLDYDPARHEQARRQFEQWAGYEKSKAGLDEAQGAIEHEREAMVRAGESAREVRQDLEANVRKKESLSAGLVRLPEMRQELAAAEAESAVLSQERSRAQEMLGSARARLERLAGLETMKKEKEAQRVKAAEEEGVYRELARAFGKGGIQALLIEVALPEIEAEANRLLARMTDNRMHVKFETQKPTKKGTVQETLDITIADELGTRAYEMFSGGEAFRINFAIRIALSRLLARRAGAPLPTLIIDEGFGTQDSAGLEKVKEAIISVQDDFEKILVITHLEELKDAFPVRIDVVKTPEGSTWSVN
jgi:DNA repair protein SbcC/Rad50